jgi:protocatechuate 3,4-dioxygenase beta subunit
MRRALLQRGVWPENIVKYATPAPGAIMLTPTAATDEDSGHHHAAPAPRVRGITRGITRRSALAASMALAGAALTGIAPAFGQKPDLRPTAADALGPFYPLTVPPDQDFDLTVVAGREGRAAGQLLYVSGRVLDTRGEPVSGAVIELWQANAAGRYAHPGDDSKPALDPNFQGYAKIRTGADGSYRIKTIKPGAYGNRTPHIHFDVKGSNSRVITQMYFAGEAKNETDPLLTPRSAAAKATLISRFGTPSGQQEKGALVALWDIVLASG